MNDDESNDEDIDIANAFMKDEEEEKGEKKEEESAPISEKKKGHVEWYNQEKGFGLCDNTTVCI